MIRMTRIGKPIKVHEVPEEFPEKGPAPSIPEEKPAPSVPRREPVPAPSREREPIPV